MASSIYSPDLHGRCIRVLDLSSVQPAGENEPLRGDLRIVSLDKRFMTPTFEALSYVWGNDAGSPSRYLTCSGVNTPITQNCYDAIRTLHCHFGIRTLWVDAICIDQVNTAEKEQQIPLMRDIYSTARRVYIWLGNATPASNQAFDWIARESAFSTVLMGAKFKPYPALILPSEVRKAARLIPTFIRKWNLRHLERQTVPYSRDAMLDLVQRPWFRRVWTLQEQVSAVEPIVLCGTSTLPWNDLWLGITKFGNMPGSSSDLFFMDTLSSCLTTQSLWLDLYQKDVQTKNITRTCFQGDGMISRLWQGLLDFLEFRNRISVKIQAGVLVAIIVGRLLLGKRPLNSLFLLLVIFSLLITSIIAPRSSISPPGTMAPWEIGFRQKLPSTLHWIRKREATNPLDKVFALYGLFHDFGMPLQQPDYSKSMGQVYLEFTCALIQWHNSLSLLTEAAAPGMPGLPTWIPNWSRRLDRVSTCEKNAARDSSPSFIIVNGSYQFSLLSRTNREQFEWTPDTAREDPGDVPKIITKAFVEDKIASILPRFQEDNEQKILVKVENREPSKAFLYNTKIMLQWLATSQQPHFYNDPSPSSMFENLFEIFHSEIWQHFGHRKQLKAKFPYWLALLNLYIPSLSVEVPDSSVDLCAQRLQEDVLLHNYHLERCNAIAGKRIFFVTEKGRLGTGLETVEIGDSIALLAGLSSPIILKDRNSYEYEVKGVAYVQGIMQGEAWPANDEEIGELVLV